MVIPSGLTDSLRTLRDGLSAGLIERDVPVRLALLAAIAGEHLLLLGPPGTAKSLIARRLRLAFSDSTYFERLLTRFTVPEELFGPLSIKGLEEDRYERLTEAYLPTASIAFLDEIFKANSAILNALLTLLNEREFDNGKRRDKTPLVAVIGASNELPEGPELGALFDRFLLRLHVDAVSKESFPSLLELQGESAPQIPHELKLTLPVVRGLQEAIERVKLPPDIVALLADLREWCLAEQIAVSDRRWRKVVKLLRASAYTNGHETVSVWDCWLLQFVIGDAPEHRRKVFEWYALRVGASSNLDSTRFTTIVTSWEDKLKHDQESRTQARHEGKPVFVGSDGKPTLSTLAPTGAKLAPFVEPTRHKHEYIVACHAQLTTHIAEAKSHQTQLEVIYSAMVATLQAHLWITRDFIATAAKRLKKQYGTIGKLVTRLEQVRQGFLDLPREAAPPPEPSPQPAPARAFKARK